MNPDWQNDFSAGRIANGPGGSFHLTAWADDADGDLTQLQFTADCGDGPLTIGADTTAPYEAFWDVSGFPDETACDVTVTAFDQGGNDTSQTESVIIDHDAAGVDIDDPAHGGTLKFYRGASEDHYIVTGVGTPGSSDGTAGATETVPAADPTWFPNCTDVGSRDDDPATDDVEFTLHCTDDDASAITGVVTPRGPVVGADAHAVADTSQVDPELFTISVEPSSDMAAAGVVCNEYTVTITDADGDPVAGVNVDIHAQGPSDALAFAITDETDPFTAPDAVGTHDDQDGGTAGVQGENAADCNNGGEGDVQDDAADTEGGDVNATNIEAGGANNVQGVHEDPDGADTDDIKHIEGATDEFGTFTFAIYSPVAGDTSLEIWADTDVEEDLHDDAGGDRERDTTASKTWYDPVITTVDVSPNAAFNNLGTQHTMTATVLDQNGNPLPGVNVNSDITAGPNEAVDPAPNPCTTDGTGECDQSYTDANAADAETDSILFWVNTGGSEDTTGGADSGEPQATVAKTWVDVTNACLDAEPEGALNPADGTHTMTAMVRAQDADQDDGACTGEPIPNATVTVDVESGPTAELSPDDNGDADTETLQTDANGELSVDLTLDDPSAGGTNVVSFIIDGAADSLEGVDETAAEDEDETDRVEKEWAVVGEPAEVDASPEYSTNERGTDHTVTVAVLDAFGNGIEGEDVTVQVTAGPNAGTNDTCTTGADGTCTVTYTDGSAAEGTDIINARLTGEALEAEGTDVDDGDFTDVVEKQWLDDAEADVVAIDMETDEGDPDTGAGFDEDNDEPDATDWDEVADDNVVDTMHKIYASAKSGDAATGNVLFGDEVTFTLDGVGEFVDADGNSLGATTTATIDGDGLAEVFINSTAVGTSTVTATVDDSSDTGTKDWFAAAARNIELTPASAINEPGSIHEVTATVTDRFGNPVEGINVDFTESGPGAFRNGVDSGTTDANGQVTVETETLETEDGRQTITGTIEDGDDDVNAQVEECDAAGTEGDPNDPAGNCSDTAEKIWGAQIDALEPTTQTVTAGEPVCLPIQVLDTDGDPIEGAEVDTELTGANEDEPITGQTGPCDDGATPQSTGEAITDADGIASFVYTPQNAGTDTITIWADFDGDNVLDDGEPSVVYTLTVEEAQVDEVIRFPGDDRMHTAILTSQDRFPDEHSADAVVLARSDDFPDALAGTPLAVGANAPLLLTPSPENWAARGQTDHIHPDTLAEIDRVLADGGPVIILGREMAIGTATQDDLDDRWNVVRLGGIDRFETAVEIADAIDTSPDTVFVTTGRKFPDALSAGAAAADVGAVIVLADEDANGTGQRNTQFTDPYLAQHATATTWAIGGPAAVAYPEADNSIAGQSRLGTAVMVAQEFFPAPTDVGIARADNFPDALSGGVHIGHIGGPLVLTQSGDLNAGWGSLNSDAGLLTQYLEDRADTISTGYLYGGLAAISGTVDAQVENAIS